MAKHSHHGGIQRRSREPAHANTNIFRGGTNGATSALDVAPDMNQPGGGQVSSGGGMPAGPGSPAPDASTQLPPGMPPVMPR